MCRQSDAVFPGVSWTHINANKLCEAKGGGGLEREGMHLGTFVSWGQSQWRRQQLGSRGGTESWAKRGQEPEVGRWGFPEGQWACLRRRSVCRSRLSGVWEMALGGGEAKGWGAGIKESGRQMSSLGTCFLNISLVRTRVLPLPPRPVDHRATDLEINISVVLVRVLFGHGKQSSTSKAHGLHKIAHQNLGKWDWIGDFWSGRAGASTHTSSPLAPCCSIISSSLPGGLLGNVLNAGKERCFLTSLAYDRNALKTAHQTTWKDRELQLDKALGGCILILIDGTEAIIFEEGVEAFGMIVRVREKAARNTGCLRCAFL
ncbi:hypothetical protein BDK51DRAFT_26078 [Blyttiomyces helicus]|uniref:Uncharacterized protein n=1 Tax=Blyttiomyces helicus TaxID=388810 RepID=A0A4V1ISR8_9FUNG|nr:hypothetical protein BDK51DRAFT_26078 [Blyttiomyces helicus]|eukprot:RKO94507.1 hypothetical protein BDK51DRAFT_26078 [Blyttiomyces helicus]